MAPTRTTTRASPATTTTTTPVTNAQLKELIDQGVTDALAARVADRSRNGDDSHNSGTGSRRTEQTTHECTYTDFLKCQPMTLRVLKELLELALLCGMMFPGESDKIEKFVGGLPDMIYRSVMALKNKRKQDDNQQQQNKRQNTGMVYTVGRGKNNPYGGSKPLCSKCNYHHDSPSAPKCHKCNRVSHLARDCRSPTATNNKGNLTFYKCGNQGHYRSDCPELKNQNHINQAGGTRARRWCMA
nr:hypothetical protein [Tanacetum cinerariifolium]